MFGPYCTSGEGEHKFLIDIFTKNYNSIAYCPKEILLTCPVDECCESISITPNPPTTNANNQCCYTFDMSTTTPDCNPIMLTISDISQTPKVGIVSISEPLDEETLMSPICFPDKMFGLYNLEFDFEFTDGEHCIKQVAVGCPDDCCSNFSLNVNPVPTEFDHSDICCYSLIYTINQATSCSLEKLVIEANNGENLFEIPINDNTPGSYTKTFCIKSDKMEGTDPYEFKVKFVGVNDFDLCVNNAFVHPCTGDVEPCLLPLEQGQEGEWTDDIEGSVRFKCPGSDNYCNVEFHYRVRHVKEGNSSKHRDIQVTDYTITTQNCFCSEAMVNAILKNIVEDQLVLDKFDIIDDPEWGTESELCYYNFRLITSDCWETLPFSYSLGKTYSKRCDESICCYAKYEICFRHTKEFGFDIYTVVSQTKISESNIMQTTCTPPCTTMNCQDWRPTGDPHTKHSFNIHTFENEDCKLNISSKIGSDELLINLECTVNGKVTLEFIDLMGNSVLKNEFDKKSYQLSLTLNQRLQSGVYFVRVTIGNSQVLYDKINIVK